MASFDIPNPRRFYAYPLDRGSRPSWAILAHLAKRKPRPHKGDRSGGVILAGLCGASGSPCPAVRVKHPVATGERRGPTGLRLFRALPRSSRVCGRGDGQEGARLPSSSYIRSSIRSSGFAFRARASLSVVSGFARAAPVSSRAIVTRLTPLMLASSSWVSRLRWRSSLSLVSLRTLQNLLNFSPILVQMPLRTLQKYETIQVSDKEAAPAVLVAPRGPETKGG